MARTVVNGVSTWVQWPRRGGAVVLLLHGGLSSSASLLRSVGPGLSKHFRVAAFDRRGHGRTADTDAPFRYEDMADETIAIIEHIGRRVHIVGHSDGGNVALLVARQRPDLLKRIVLVGANYHYNGVLPFDFFALDSPEFEVWAARFAANSPDGIEHARTVYEKTMHLFATSPTMTTEELRSVDVPALVMAGDDDLIDHHHTIDLFEALPQGQLAIIPASSHAVLKEHPKESVRIIRNFLSRELPVSTLSPVRRSTPT